ncbi:MAG: hypothetical protein Q4F67_05055 [Propionibacteriaceae bacterium]|nr:hypothetical protein [Propionibacteriaceae bacterium]
MALSTFDRPHQATDQRADERATSRGFLYAALVMAALTALLAPPLVAAFPAERSPAPIVGGVALVALGITALGLRSGSERTSRIHALEGLSLLLYLSPLLILSLVFPLAREQLAAARVGAVSLTALLLACCIAVPWVSQAVCLPIYRALEEFRAERDAAGPAEAAPRPSGRLVAGALGGLVLGSVLWADKLLAFLFHGAEGIPAFTIFLALLPAVAGYSYYFAVAGRCLLRAVALGMALTMAVTTTLAAVQPDRIGLSTTLGIASTLLMCVTLVSHTLAELGHRLFAVLISALHLVALVVVIPALPLMTATLVVAAVDLGLLAISGLGYWLLLNQAPAEAPVAVIERELFPRRGVLVRQS